jgi:hypothetical protein
MEVTMNINRLLKHRYPESGSCVPPTWAVAGCNLRKAVRAASAAAIIVLTAVSTAGADPATGSPTSTVELAGYQAPPRGYQCVPMVRGKYTGWQCEKRSTATRDKAVAKTP